MLVKLCNALLVKWKPCNIDPGLYIGAAKRLYADSDATLESVPPQVGDQHNRGLHQLAAKLCDKGAQFVIRSFDAEQKGNGLEVCLPRLKERRDKHPLLHQIWAAQSLPILANNEFYT